MEENCSLSSHEYAETSEKGPAMCEPVFDRVICWPRTPPSSHAHVSCPNKVNEVVLLPGNATRYCDENATWQKAVYEDCMPSGEPEPPEDDGSRYAFIIKVVYYTGYSVSVVALLVAVSLFMFFRTLRCLRNLIHCHLMVTFILKNIAWLKSISILPLLADESTANLWLCRTVTTLINYLLVTNFFWMLVEGLYLHTIIVSALSAEKLRLWHYILLGWGCPVVFVMVWVILRLVREDSEDRCWLRDGGIGYVLNFPIFAVLILNFLFLISIVWILVTKLRATNSTQNCLYRKAARATLILFPLLGLTYILFIWVPADENFFPTVAFINALLQSTQGLSVAIFYCFLNSESMLAFNLQALGKVQSTVRHWFSRWRNDGWYQGHGSKGTHIDQISLGPPGVQPLKPSPLMCIRRQPCERAVLAVEPVQAHEILQEQKIFDSLDNEPNANLITEREN